MESAVKVGIIIRKISYNFMYFTMPYYDKKYKIICYYYILPYNFLYGILKCHVGKVKCLYSGR